MANRTGMNAKKLVKRLKDWYDTERSDELSIITINSKGTKHCENPRLLPVIPQAVPNTALSVIYATEAVNET